MVWPKSCWFSAFCSASLEIGLFVLVNYGITGPSDFQIQNLLAISAFLFCLYLRVCLFKNSLSEVLMEFQVKKTEVHISALHLNMEASEISIKIYDHWFVLFL